MACEAKERLATLLDQHHDFVWRLLRRFGVRTADCDDAAQQVFLVAARRLDDIEPGRERSFLTGTAMRVASEHRRRSPSQREVSDDGLEERPSLVPPADELVDQKRARALLDLVLDAMDLELRAVFVLFELEGASLTEIAELTSLPRGTVASRLRRARVDFEDRVRRIQARNEHGGHTP